MKITVIKIHFVIGLHKKKSFVKKAFIYTVRHKIRDFFKRLYLKRIKSDSNKIGLVFRVYIEKVFF